MEGFNSVVLEIPDLVGTEAAMTMSNIRQQLSYFGDIEAVTMFHDPVPSLMVSFTDPSAAAAAREAFGTSWDVKDWGVAAEVFSPASVPAFNSPWDTAQSIDLGMICAEDVNSAIAAHVGMLLHTPSASSNDLQSLLGSGIEASSSKSASDESPMASDQSSAAWNNKIDAESFPVLPTPPNSKPRFLNGLELFQLNWERLANGHEWRRDLLLRGLPRQLCEQGLLELFLAKHDLREDVSKVSLLPNRGVRFSSAVVHTTSAQATYRIAKLFHGAQFAGLRSPIAVSFAGQKTRSRRCSTEPMCVKSMQLEFGCLSTGLEPPPGL